MVSGVEDPQALAAMAKGRLRSKQEDLEQALVGLVGTHQRFLLREMLGHIDGLDAQIERLDREIEERMRPFERELELLDTIPG
jgi:transposase